MLMVPFRFDLFISIRFVESYITGLITQKSGKHPIQIHLYVLKLHVKFIIANGCLRRRSLCVYPIDVKKDRIFTGTPFFSNETPSVADCSSASFKTSATFGLPLPIGCMDVTHLCRPPLLQNLALKVTGYFGLIFKLISTCSPQSKPVAIR